MIRLLISSLSWRERKRFQDASGHGLDEGHSIRHNRLPLGVVPRRLATSLSVSHGGVAPNVVDEVKLSQLWEESSVGDVRSHGCSALDALGPVVGPVVHRPRQELVRSDVINIAARSFVWRRPERKCFFKFFMFSSYSDQA